MPRVTDQRIAVKSPTLPRHIVEQKALEVAAVVRARMARAVPGQDVDDVYQEAVLWALEWAERYGGKFEGDNPFTPMAKVAFRRVVHAVRKAEFQTSVSEHVTQRRLSREVAPARAVPIAGCGYSDGIEDDGCVKAVQVGEPAREPLLPGEAERRQRAAQVLRSLAPEERRLVRDVVTGGRSRSKIGRRRARRGARAVRGGRGSGLLDRVGAAGGSGPAPAAAEHAAPTR